VINSSVKKRLQSLLENNPDLMYNQNALIIKYWSEYEDFPFSDLYTPAETITRTLRLLLADKKK